MSLQKKYEMLSAPLENAELYHENHSLQKRDAVQCLREYGGRIRWLGRDRVVDLGSGDGDTTAGVLRAFLPRDFAQLVGCDVSARMVQFARAHYEDERTTFCELDLGAPLPQDMRDNFDHAFSFHTIHWVRDQERAFLNIYEMLAPGGDCLLMFMTRQPLVDMVRYVAAQATWRGRTRMPDLRIFNYHDTLHPEEEVKTWMKNAGFKDILVELKATNYILYDMDKIKGAILSVSPFDIPEELREEYVRAHLQAVRDLRLPTYRLEESDAPEHCRVHLEYGVIIASGITDSPLCRACMEVEETAAHVLLECKGVASYRVAHLGDSRTLQEVVSDRKSLLDFLEEAGSKRPAFFTQNCGK